MGSRHAIGTPTRWLKGRPEEGPNRRLLRNCEIADTGELGDTSPLPSIQTNNLVIIARLKTGAKLTTDPGIQKSDKSYLGVHVYKVRRIFDTSIKNKSLCYASLRSLNLN